MSKLLKYDYCPSEVLQYGLKPGISYFNNLSLKAGVIEQNSCSWALAHNLATVIKYIIAITISLFLFACKGKKKVGLVNPDVFYTCSMHPQIMQDRPGNCPICGMKLIQVEKKKGTDADAIMLSDQQIQLGNIQVDTVGKRNIGDETTLTATLNIDETKTETVSARVSGRIDRLWFKNQGDYISKGQKLYDLMIYIVKNSTMPNRNTFWLLKNKRHSITQL